MVTTVHGAVGSVEPLMTPECCVARVLKGGLRSCVLHSQKSTDSSDCFSVPELHPTGTSSLQAASIGLRTNLQSIFEPNIMNIIRDRRALLWSSTIAVHCIPIYGCFLHVLSFPWFILLGYELPQLILTFQNLRELDEPLRYESIILQLPPRILILGPSFGCFLAWALIVLFTVESGRVAMIIVSLVALPLVGNLCLLW